MVDRLKFSIYCRKSGRLINLYQINRTPSGLYLNAPHDPLKATMRQEGGPRSASSGFTYHEDGKSWFKTGGDHSALERVETPLSDFRGARTIGTGAYVVLGGGIDRVESSVDLRPQDVIVDRPVPFGVEIILSDCPRTLPPDPERPNSELHTFDQVFPVVLVEVFDLVEGLMPRLRFPRTEPLIEGETVFFEHRGRI